MAQETEERATKQQQAQAQRRKTVTERLATTLHTLTTLQRRFLIEYLSQLRPNATQAYIDAGGTATHADRAAHKIRHHPNVVQAIDEYFHAQEMSAAEVVARLSQQAAAGYADYLTATEDGLVEVDLARLIAEGNGHLIKKIDWKQVAGAGVQVVEFYDAQTALVQVGRYHNLFGGRGDEDEPVHHVHQSLDEWRAEQQRRRQEAAEMLALFED